MASISIVLDCDPGYDDALALLPARAELRVLASLTVAGSEALDRTTQNVVRGLTLLCRTDVPVGADPFESATSAAHIRDAMTVAWLAVPDRVTSAWLQVVIDAVGRFT